MRLSLVTTVDPDMSVMEDFLSAVSRFQAVGGPIDEVLLVDDLSVLEEGMLMDMPGLKVRILRPPSRVGQLQALVTGVLEARGDAVVTLDPDMHSNVPDLVRFVEAWQGGSELVFAWRRRREGVSHIRRMLTSFYNALARILAGVPLQDFNTSMILLSRNAISSLAVMPPHVRSARLYLLHRFAGAVAEVPIQTLELPGRESSYSWLGRMAIFHQRLMEILHFRRWRKQAARRQELS